MFQHYKKMKPIVFLNIDDVVAIDPNYSGSTVDAALKNNRNIEERFWSSVFLISTVGNLSILHEIFSPRYVISSIWTNYLNRDLVKFAFNSAGLDFVAKNLQRQWRTPETEFVGRLIEIQKWVSKFGVATQPMLIIDDFESGWNLVDSFFDQNDQFVLCEQRVGFDKTKLDNAIQELSAQINDPLKKLRR